jgi:hypothetical protein
MIHAMGLHKEDWKSADTHIFWGEIAPSDHVVQIYENDEVFLETLAGYVGGGINSGDSVILIATQNHLRAIERKLELLGIHIGHLIAQKRYIPLDADKTLSGFMVDGWPDEELFFETVTKIIKDAKVKNRRIRAFGEMVAILWAKGMNGATVQLEHLWNKLAENEEFCLFCAYPKSGFTQTPSESVEDICCTHTKLINGEIGSMKQILYKTSRYKVAI